MRWVGGADIWYSQDPHPQGGQPTNGRIIEIAEILPKEHGVQAPHWAPRLGALHQKMSPQNICL